MKNSILSAFDKVTAAGILARAALSLEDNNNPAAETKIPNESSIRSQLVDEIRRSLGINHPIETQADVEMIVDVLDSESDKLLDPVDKTKVLESLSKKGELPADLYDVSIDEGLLEFFGKKADSERKLIERTIKYRDTEQHFTQAHDGFGEFPLISLFSKRIECKFAARSFTMLVAGLRNGTYMHVSQAWRLYDDSLIKLSSTNTLLEILEKFANVFGITFTTGGQSGRFFLQSKVEGKSIEDLIEFNLRNDSGKKRRFSFIVSHFDSGAKDGTRLGSLIYAIDLIKYRHVLTAHGWETERFDEFHSPMGTWKKFG